MDGRAPRRSQSLQQRRGNLRGILLWGYLTPTVRTQASAHTTSLFTGNRKGADKNSGTGGFVQNAQQLPTIPSLSHSQRGSLVSLTSTSPGGHRDGSSILVQVNKKHVRVRLCGLPLHASTKTLRIASSCIHKDFADCLFMRIASAC